MLKLFRLVLGSDLSSYTEMVIICGSFCCITSGCTTTPVGLIKLPSPPEYIQVPHPAGMDLGDISALFLDEKAPKDVEFSKDCDANFRKIQSLTLSFQERIEGVRELVRRNPIYYHWCFYSKVLELEKKMNSEAFVDEKQKEILTIYEFLTPVARSFLSDFHDSRYLRWAVNRYQQLSDWIFCRKLELNPSGTMDMVQPTQPLGLYRISPESPSVLEKYHIPRD